jgi:TM2 domain-containing membrane protein YozV
MAAGKKPSQGIAIAALLLNILVLPGLGTIIGGRTTQGVIQLVLFIIGIPLSMVLIGIPLVIAMWIWALVSGIQIIKEAE